MSAAMKLDAERAAFEAAFSNFDFTIAIDDDGDEIYKDDLTQGAFLGWNRRATSPQGELSVLPELPPCYPIKFAPAYRDFYTSDQMRAYGLLCRCQGSDAKDAERLQFLIEREAWIAWSKDGESCRLFHRSDDDGEPMPMLGWGARHWSNTPREAIDAAIAQQREGGE